MNNSITPFRQERLLFFTFIIISCFIMLPFTGLATAGASSQSGELRLDSQSGDSMQVAQQTATNNSTADHHQNPDNSSEDGNLTGVSSRLAQTLTSQLGQSSIQISEGEYDQAREYIGPEYREQLGRFVDVAGQTAGDSDDQVSDQLNETTRTQRQLTGALERLNETASEYQSAQQSGNQTRARELAHELQTLSEDVEENRSALARDYELVANQTGVNLSDELNQINQTVENELTEVEEIQEAEFNRTELSVRTTSANASFSNPAILRGEITSNGTGLSQRSIQLSVGGRQLETTTNESGGFSVLYRPVTVSTGAQEIDIEYVPRNSATYQTSNATIQLEIEQVQPTVTVNISSTTLQFNESANVSGQVTVDGQAVPVAPVTISIENQTLTNSEANETGQYEDQVRIPANVPNGTQSIRVTAGNQSQAIGLAEETTTIQIQPTEVRLGINVTHRNETGSIDERRTVIVEGRLTTVNGTALGGEELEVEIEGSPVGTVVTQSDGVYQTVIEIPRGMMPRTPGRERGVSISVVYNDSETNFERTTATGGALVQAELIAVIQRNLAVSDSLAAFLFIGVAIGLRRRYDTDENDDRATQTSEDAATEDDQDVDNSVEVSVVRQMFMAAEGFVERGQHKSATVVAYASVRWQLTEELDVSNRQTHEEFCHACREAGLDADSHSLLEQLTERFEQAAYDRRTTSAGTANDALSLAEAILDDIGPADIQSVVKERPQTDSVTEPSSGKS